MNRIKVLIVAFATFSLVAGTTVAQQQPKAAAKQTCCQKAAAEKKECRNKCCLAAHREGKSCVKCNPGKEDLEAMKKLTRRAAK